ncbi:MAG TPA: cytochrome D1 domain-containing protein [Anaerolineales bacterium]|nr:cytochrome D1 domain-containing protein [Anaerolineales bacterium]
MKAIRIFGFLLFAGILSACGGSPAEISSKEYLLTTALEDGEFMFLGVSGDINGAVNPTLTAEPGETITVVLVNGGWGKHNIYFPELKVESDIVSEKGETASVTFKVPSHETEIEYYDSVANHAELGMVGILNVTMDVPFVVESSLGQAFQKGGCGACHTIPGVPGAVGQIGPDLSDIGLTAGERIAAEGYSGAADSAEGYIHESLVAPNAFVVSECPGGPCQEGAMPTVSDILNDEELGKVISYLVSLPDGAGQFASEMEAGAVIGEVPEMTDADFAWATQTYFERCAGCHGTLRNGATGPALPPDLTLQKGTLALSSIIFNGTTKGMPDWGKQGFFTQSETDLMAEFIQNEPPAPPELSMEQMKNSWTVFVAPEDRPTEPQTTRDWENYFSVTLRDAGQVAVIDGDTYEVVNTVDTGYAVHITRMSATGRYGYVIGRDGKLALVDFWMEKPEKVAEIQTCYDARSVEVSKYVGEEGDFTDQYAIVGCYWPPHFTILDGQTLEPLKVVSTRSYTYDTNEYHPEPRVAAILASHYNPEWIVNVKESGQVWLVNYTDPFNPTIKMIEAERFLHDGGVDSTGQYFLVAANAANKVAVIDLKLGDLIAMVDTPAVPHPGRGANWIDPEFGPVWSTAHLGDPAMLSIGTDPEGNPDSAWKAVRTTPLPGSGSLFNKTHPNSQWIWVDMVLNSDPVLSRTICVIAKADPSVVHKCWEIAHYGRAVHIEYNKAGTEVWISVWGTADVPGQTGEIVVYNDETLEEVTRIKGLITPTGKFNVYNTVNDIY